MKLTKEMKDYIRGNHKGIGPKEMTEIVNDKFEASITRSQMKAFYGNNKLNSGLTGYFEKGCTPFNKGLKQEDYMSPEGIEASKKTRFKKGAKRETLPVGTLRLRSHKNPKGRSPRVTYWEKVAEPSTWREKHRLEWEKHYGPIPKDCVVQFANGDSTDYRIENLVLTRKNQHGVKNRIGLHSYDKKSTEVANTIADLIMATKKRKRKEKKDE